MVSTVPAAGSIDASLSLPIAATFSEPVAPASVTTATFELRDSTNALVPTTVAAGSDTATLQPSVILAPAVTYTATLKGGPSGVKDLSGNPLSADYSWSFTTAATLSYTIWPPTAGPTNTFNDATPVEPV